MGINPITRNTMEIEVGKKYKVISFNAPIIYEYYRNPTDRREVEVRTGSILPTNVLDMYITPSSQSDLQLLADLSESIEMSSITGFEYLPVEDTLKHKTFRCTNWGGDWQSMTMNWLVDNGFCKSGHSKVVVQDCTLERA